MHSHHSHSGDYVSHASDTLEAITNRAIEMAFETYCLTEHMPRLDKEFLYPEEVEKKYTIDNLNDNFDRFYKHARKLQREKRNEGCTTTFLVGLEVEGIDLAHINYAKQVIKKYPVDMTVGSVHHVKSIPIDFDVESWNKAKEASGGTAKALFREYFELQYKVITMLKPSVIGHFDLIRLFLPDDEMDEESGKLVKDLDLQRDWPDIWQLIIRNIKAIVSYGGCIEVNSAAIRKGWSTPYPKPDIFKAIMANDGRFCLSDDAHSVAQVGLNYDKALSYIQKMGLKYLFSLAEDDCVVANSIAAVEDVKFWYDNYPAYRA